MRWPGTLLLPAFFEERVGAGFMVGGKTDARFGAFNFGFQHRNAELQLIDRQRVQIFPLQIAERVTFATGQILVKFHM